MKNTILAILLVTIIGVFAFSEYSPSAKSLGSEIEEMEVALEKHFDCKIDTTHYQLIGWYHTLYFGLAEDTKNSVSEQEAQKYLTEQFPEFGFVDEFEIR